MWNGAKPRTRLRLLCLSIAVFTAQALAGGSGVRQYLDASTAATILTIREPLVFARERTELAVNARDYFYLVPVDVNRSGKHSLYWLAYAWSTIVSRGDTLLFQKSDELVLVADDRPIALHRANETLREAGIAELPLRPPVKNAQLLLFGADRDTLSFAGAAAQLSLHLIGEGGNQIFAPWRVRNRVLQEFSLALETGTP